MLKGLCVSVIVVVVCLGGAASFNPIEDCVFKAGGKTYDLSPLIAPNGSYSWQQTMYQQDVTDLFIHQGDLVPVTFKFELQFCRNVKSQNAKCSTPSAANWITSDGNCTNLGSVDLAAIEMAPYGDGVVIQYFDGAAANHIEHFQVRLYVICDPSKHGPTQPYAEHLKTFNQWHFRMDTDVVC